MIVYTLSTCDTCRKALKWLEENNVSHENRDIRKDRLSSPDIEHIVRSVGWENALNRRSTTWRGLSDAQKKGLDASKAVDLIAANPTLMKRPAFVTEQEVMVGWNDAVKAWLTA